MWFLDKKQFKIYLTIYITSDRLTQKQVLWLLGSDKIDLLCRNMASNDNVRLLVNHMQGPLFNNS